VLCIFRACSAGNPNKKRPISGDKIDLVRLCFNSFLRSFEGVDYKLICLLDKPTPELRKIFAGHETEETYYAGFTEGNVGSFHRQIELALEYKQPFLFVEDDYYWLEGAGSKIAGAVKELPFVTPYDHPRYYDEEKHEYSRDIKIVSNHHFASIKSTTLTFGGRYESVFKEADTMKKYGWVDEEMWLDITQREALYAAIPTLATHMETEHLSLTVDWFANPFI
jgi:hypothetical protein